MMMATASIAFTDIELRPTRHAGRGGVGAVMGSKGVKAIVVDDTGMKMRPPKDPDKFNLDLIEEVKKDAKKLSALILMSAPDRLPPGILEKLEQKLGRHVR